MALPFALMAAGTALQVYGQYQANQAQAKAELQNSKFYKEQADFAWSSSIRETDIAMRRYTQEAGAQRGAYARGGVDISGSAAATIADTLSRMAEEKAAIRYKGDMDYKLAILRSRNSAETAATLQDPLYNLMQAGGTTLTNVAKSSDSWAK